MMVMKIENKINGQLIQTLKASRTTISNRFQEELQIVYNPNSALVENF